MKLVQLKVRGLGETPETGWIKLNPSLTYFQFSSKPKGENFFKAIQTINPPYDCTTARPFSEYPQQEKAGKSAGTGISKTRTVALAVFAAEVSLIKKLATLTPILYETDLIEIGRRLNYSRWINFIEIASSTRWDEISTELENLLKTGHMSSEGTYIQGLLDTFSSTDRISGSVAETLENRLANLKQESAGLQIQITDILDKVRRSAYFTKARSIVEEHIPLFVSIQPNSISYSDSLSYNTRPFPDQKNKLLRKMVRERMKTLFPDTPSKIGRHSSNFEHLQLLCSYMISAAEMRSQPMPIILLDLLDLEKADTTPEQIDTFLQSLTKCCQCLCIVNESFPVLSPPEARFINELEILKKNGHTG